MKQIEVIEVDDAPAPNGHYSHAIACDGVVFVSGQLGRGPGMSDAEAGDIVAQTRRSLAGIDAILRASGSELSRLLKVNVYVTDIANWPAVNAVYREVLAAHRPARAVIAVGPLHFGALIEIDAIAAIGAVGRETSINPRLQRSA